MAKQKPIRNIQTGNGRRERARELEGTDAGVSPVGVRRGDTGDIRVDA